MNNNYNNNKLKIGHLNVRSLFTGFEDLTRLITENNFDIFCVSETWLNENISSNIVNIPNYCIFRKDRIGRGGGVGIYIREDIVCREFSLDFGQLEGLEYLCLDIKINKMPLLLGVLYRAPANNINICVNHMDDLLSFLCPQFENIIFLGDINIDQAFENSFAYCMSSYDFTQIIEESTRITGSSEKLIDVIFTNRPDHVLNQGTLNADLISDHRAIFCDLNVTLNRPKPKTITYRNFKNFVYENFLVDLNNVQWDNIFYLDNIEKKVQYLAENILVIFNKHAPYVTSRVTKPYAPWLTDNIKQLMKERKKALSKYEKSKSCSDLLYYRQLRNITVSAIKREKAAYLLFQQNNSNAKDLWKSLKHLNIKQQQNTDIPTYLRKPDEVNSYFSSIFHPLNNCPDTTNWYLSHTFDENITFQFKLPTVTEVQSVIDKLKSNAYGSDEISITMIHLCSVKICKHITHIINCCLESSYFPNKWKISLIKPIPKIKEPKSFNDLRPITLIPTLSKILEKIVQPQIYNYVINNNIISPLQSGFRKGHSTTSVLTNISDNIFRSLDSGKATVLTLLDFSKAFDTLDHSLLCAKLVYFGFDISVVSFFKSYLEGRSQVVVFDDKHSSSRPITSGVPQGSVLGPLLFLIYTADIFTSIKFCNIQCYADDTQLEYSFNVDEINNACFRINSDLHSILQFSIDHNLKLNADKCAAILFCSNKLRDILTTNLNLKLDNHPLSTVHKVKNLGIIFEDNLRFKEHVALLVRKTYVALKLLYTNISLINFKLRKKLCETLVLPILNYGNIVYYSCLDKLTQYRLQKIQNSCCRFVYRLKKFDRVSNKINDLGWLRVDNLYKYHLSVFLKTILQTDSPPYLRGKLVFRHNIHDANLRSINCLSLPRYRSTMFQRSFSYNAVTVFNSITPQLKTLPVNNFRRKVKLYFLSLQQS